MQYKRIVEGRFISRPNRFVAVVNLDGEDVAVHVKNTGRCKELLTDGAVVYLEDSMNDQRKLRYSLVAVRNCWDMYSNAFLMSIPVLHAKRLAALCVKFLEKSMTPWLS